LKHLLGCLFRRHRFVFETIAISCTISACFLCSCLWYCLYPGRSFSPSSGLSCLGVRKTACV
jgi:hypothetical protein